MRFKIVVNCFMPASARHADCQGRYYHHIKYLHLSIVHCGWKSDLLHNLYECLLMIYILNYTNFLLYFILQLVHFKYIFAMFVAIGNVGKLYIYFILVKERWQLHCKVGKFKSQSRSLASKIIACYFTDG